MMQRCHISSEDLRVIVAAGEIKSWPYRGIRQRMTAVYTLPDAKDPRTKEMIEAKPPSKPEKKAAPAKAWPVAHSVPRDGGAKPAPRPPKAAVAVGSSPFAAVIADLEHRRDVINNAIEGLRALA
jgi:hypothetical protein